VLGLFVTTSIVPAFHRERDCHAFIAPIFLIGECEVFSRQRTAREDASHGNFQQALSGAPIE
jgi:hypothetical protein